MSTKRIDDIYAWLCIAAAAIFMLVFGGHLVWAIITGNPVD